VVVVVVEVEEEKQARKEANNMQTADEVR
jgi:hypothetical protein